MIVVSSVATEGVKVLLAERWTWYWLKGAPEGPVYCVQCRSAPLEWTVSGAMRVTASLV